MRRIGHHEEAVHVELTGAGGGPELDPSRCAFAGASAVVDEEPTLPALFDGSHLGTRRDKQRAWLEWRRDGGHGRVQGELQGSERHFHTPTVGGHD